MRFPFTIRRLCLSKLIWLLVFVIFLGLAGFIVVEVLLWIEQSASNETLLVNEGFNITVSEIENAARMIFPLNSSALNLARALSISLNGTTLSFPVIQAKIAPALFQAFTTLPRVTEISYTGLDRLAFSYYSDDDQTFAAFSNSSSSALSYTQPVNHDSGKLFGEAVSSNSTSGLNTSRSAFNTSRLSFNTSSLPEKATPYISLEMGKNAQDLLLKSTVPMDGRGQISIGFPVDEVNNHFSHIDFHGAHFHLAANDGHVLVETKLPDAQIFVDNGTVTIKLTDLDGDRGDELRNVSCKSDDSDIVCSDVIIRKKKHKIYCSTIEVAGVESVYALLFPIDRMEAAAQRNSKLAIVLLVLMLVGTVFSLCLFIFLILRAARREILLCDALIKQKESTQQAERKSMRKTFAFAANSHDLRAPLGHITCLVELCREDANLNSRLATNLSKIDENVEDMLGKLNTALDTSKIEAGKIQLKEEEFNLAQMLENVVDMYYPVGIKKGVDVMIDPCDSSILKFYQVRGDEEKLKEILENLLGNAMKFTERGHVVVRIIVRKTSNENAIIASNRRSLLKRLSRLCFKANGSLRSVDDIHTVHENPNCMEFIFEVDDSGCGIKKENQNSVFEHYVRYNDTSGQEGWGLGLGIVQSLVRLMGGEIRIVHKENGEVGTCFRFNIFLPTCNPPSADMDENRNHILDGASSTDLLHYIGKHNRSPVMRLEGSHVVLLLKGKERRKVSKKVIENFGIKVSVAGKGEQLRCILEKIKDKLEVNYSQKSESSPNAYLSASSNSSSGIIEGCSGTKDGHVSSPPQRKISNSKGLHNFILVVIDAAIDLSSEASTFLSNFKKETRISQCKVVWCDDPIIHNRYSRDQKEDMSPHPPPWDYVLSEPFHGSALYQVLRLIPGFREAFLPESLEVKNKALQAIEGSTNTGLEKFIISPGQAQQLQEIVIHDQTADQSLAEPLKGKSVLVVDDVQLLRQIASTKLRKLGAKVEVCENGREAFYKFCKALNDEGENHQKGLPYDYILMDCEMPEMNGYEATRLIREEEKLRGIHIPIFALTSHPLTEEDGKMVDAGMDSHLCKPLEDKKLLDAIRHFESRSQS